MKPTSRGVAESNRLADAQRLGTQEAKILNRM